MKKTLLFALFSTGLIFAKPYAIDKSHSSVWFEAKHLVFSKVRGTFDNFDGKIDVDPDTKKINVFEGSVDVKSINTRDKKRDNHLRATDFFDVIKYPKGSFKMTKYEDGKIYGDLTFRGVTKPIVLKAEVEAPLKHPVNKKEFVVLEAEGKINRKDFGIGKETKNAIVGDEIEIDIKIEAYAQ
ncbi:Protein yceI precursor [Helicobacter mustelae]|uniref:YceI family protein n=1 Tax=Helicobacter mustelae TaxID=217 RepID=UPI000DFFD931|nr:YceI family protein [Helicobacter mustelae]STP12112.1 Protein yceI precursor [Helicobacter mustelae]